MRSGALRRGRRTALAGLVFLFSFCTPAAGQQAESPGTIRYQLLHRTASSVIEARRYHARFAVMLVHSFSPTHEWLEDYQAFLTLFGRSGGVGQLVALPEIRGVELFVGWAAGRAV